jgi:hypothetical protein
MHGRQISPIRGWTMNSNNRFEQEQIDAAATEAAEIGGAVGEEDLDPAERPVIEAGGGESEGFEMAQEELIDHASHGDQRPAHAILRDQGAAEESDPEREDSEADHERSSERNSDE